MDQKSLDIIGNHTWAVFTVDCKLVKIKWVHSFWLNISYDSQTDRKLTTVSC